MRMRHNFMWLAPLYNIFPYFLTNGKIFEKKDTEHKISVLIFATDFVCNISHSIRNERVKIKNYISLHVKYPLLFSDFNEN
jgi:hypothetical protein